MIEIRFGDVEIATKNWLAGTEVAPLVARSPGVFSIYLAMPKAAPIPSVILSKVSGGPSARTDIPQGEARLTFDCWGTTRDQASRISHTLISELESLPRTGGYVDATTGVYLGSAHVVLHRWQPGADSDTPRYIVDALITTVT